MRFALVPAAPGRRPAAHEIASGASTTAACPGMLNPASLSTGARSLAAVLRVLAGPQRPPAVLVGRRQQRLRRSSPAKGRAPG